MLAHGRGDPAFFNEPLIIDGLRDHGVLPEDAPDFMNSTCVEIKVVGRSNMWVTAPYFNLPQGLLNVMEAVARQEMPAPATFAALQEQVRANLAGTVAAKAQELDRIWQARAEQGCFPLASCFIRDCLERGLDFDRGGARYNWVENSFVGLANLVDSLLAVRHLVYETGELSIAEFVDILRHDFEGHEELRQRILNTLPQYGNDHSEADELAREWAEFLIAATAAQTVGPHRYVPGFFCWIMHERMGSQTGATPDGRRALWPLADGAGAVQGREKHGPTASVLSTTAWSHRDVLGGLVHNVKFSSRALGTDTDRAAVRQLIETYLRRGGFEIQVNVVSRETLLEAREHPERHRDLLVRVAGYSDYFISLNDKMQAEIIARTEHTF
jgi:trans-4-hydroxy-L-proline dehydratase